MIKYNLLKNILISILFVFCIYYLWKLDILYSYSLFPVISDGRLHVFADWAMPVKLAICHKLGFDILYPNSCMNSFFIMVVFF